MSSPEPQVKGVAFRTIAPRFCYRTLLAASWYPISWYRATFRAFREVTGSGAELPRSIGRLAARHDMSGVHKQIFAKLVSPQALLAMSQRVFNTYYDTGSASVIESRKGYVRMTFSGCTGWDENMWSELAGSCESLLEIAGARHTRLQLLAGGADTDAAEFEARWV